MDDFKELGHDLWKNKPLLIAALIGLVAVAYILIKNSKGQLAASVASTTMPTGSTLPTGAGGTYVENSYTTYAPTTTTTTNPIQTITAPVTTPVAAALTQMLTIRQTSNVDKSRKIKVIPVRADANGGATLGTLTFGSKIQDLGPAISGAFNNPLSGGSGSNLWYPVTFQGKTGYISAYDIGSAS